MSRVAYVNGRYLPLARGGRVDLGSRLQSSATASTKSAWCATAR